MSGVSGNAAGCRVVFFVVHGIAHPRDGFFGMGRYFAGVSMVRQTGQADPPQKADFRKGKAVPEVQLELIRGVTYGD